MSYPRDAEKSAVSHIYSESTMITETALEMHFHRLLMELIRANCGLGEGGGMHFFKYSPQRECFVGFDQAYVRTELSEGDFFERLRKASTKFGYKLADTFFGYFLQFKVVRVMNSRSKYTPEGLRPPHYRVALDTRKNMRTQLSQHELLYKLNTNYGAMVYYACPMLFDRSDFYSVNVDLDALRLAELDSCPSTYTDNDNHFLFFPDQLADPIWRSEPVKGESVTADAFAKAVCAKIREKDPGEAALSLLKMLTDYSAAGISADAPEIAEHPFPSILPFISESLTIVLRDAGVPR